MNKVSGNHGGKLATWVQCSGSHCTRGRDKTGRMKPQVFSMGTSGIVSAVNRTLTLLCHCGLQQLYMGIPSDSECPPHPPGAKLQDSNWAIVTFFSGRKNLKTHPDEWVGARSWGFLFIGCLEWDKDVEGRSEHFSRFFLKIHSLASVLLTHP